MRVLGERRTMCQHRKTLTVQRQRSASITCCLLGHLLPFSIVLLVDVVLNGQQAWGFNLETRLPIVKYSNEPDSYFGYSVASHVIGENNYENNTKW